MFVRARLTIISALLALLVAGAVRSVSVGAQPRATAPTFTVDATWPLEFPNQNVMPRPRQRRTPSVTRRWPPRSRRARRDCGRDREGGSRAPHTRSASSARASGRLHRILLAQPGART